MKAPVTFDALNNAWVRLAMTAPQGNGGACYGDSGGPNFTTINGTTLLVGDTVTGDTPCYATNVAYRTDTASARSEFEFALRSRPEDPQVLEGLAQAHALAGANDEAVPLLRKALALRDNADPSLTAQLGAALQKSGAGAEAVTLLQGAMERTPASADVRANLADALVAQGRKDEALTVLREGVARRPDSALLQRSLGAALEQSGNTKEAADAYRAYVRLSPDAPDSKALAERAAALDKTAAPQS